MLAYITDNSTLLVLEFHKVTNYSGFMPQYFQRFTFPLRKLANLFRPGVDVFCRINLFLMTTRQFTCLSISCITHVSVHPFPRMKFHTGDIIKSLFDFQHFLIQTGWNAKVLKKPEKELLSGFSKVCICIC